MRSRHRQLLHSQAARVFTFSTVALGDCRLLCKASGRRSTPEQLASWGVSVRVRSGLHRRGDGEHSKAGKVASDVELHPEHNDVDRSAHPSTGQLTALPGSIGITSKASQQTHAELLVPQQPEQKLQQQQQHHPSALDSDSDSKCKQSAAAGGGIKQLNASHDVSLDPKGCTVAAGLHDERATAQSNLNRDQAQDDGHLQVEADAAATISWSQAYFLQTFCLSFNGLNDYVRLPAGLFTTESLQHGFTFEVTFKCSSDDQWDKQELRANKPPGRIHVTHLPLPCKMTFASSLTAWGWDWVYLSKLRIPS